MSCILFNRASYEMLIENSCLARTILNQFVNRQELDGEFFMSWSEWMFNLNAAAHRERYRNVTAEEVEEAGNNTEADDEFAEIKDWDDPVQLAALFGRIGYQCAEFAEYHPKRASVEMLNEIRARIAAEAQTPAYAAKVEQRRQEQRAQHNAQVAELTAKLRAKYPNAKPASAFKTTAARVAANMRTELKAKYPGVKFEIKSKSYSGGNSVTVRYTDGPAFAKVEAIVNRYESGSFNGLDDSYDYDHSAIGEAFDAVFGRVRHTFVERSYTPDAMRSAADLVSMRYSNETPMTVKVSDYDGHAYIETDWSRENQRHDIYALLHATDLRF